MKHIFALLLSFFLCSPAFATTVLWTGDKLLSDSLLTYVDIETLQVVGYEVGHEKFKKIGQYWLGSCWSAAASEKFYNKFSKDPKVYQSGEPHLSFADKGPYGILIIKNKYEGYYYDGGKGKLKAVIAPFAMGSGGPDALRALLVDKKTPEQSVRFAELRDTYSGGPIYEVSVDEDQKDIKVIVPEALDKPWI